MTNMTDLFILDMLTMNFTISILTVFLLIITIGAPPVVENPQHAKQDSKTKSDESDEVVRSILIFFLFLTSSFS